MPKKLHLCADCGRKAKVGYRYCWSCEKTVRRNMAADGYLTDITGLFSESQVAAPSERNRTYTGRGEDKSRVTRDLPFRQLSGAMLPSGKKRKK